MTNIEQDLRDELAAWWDWRLDLKRFMEDEVFRTEDHSPEKLDDLYQRIRRVPGRTDRKGT